MSEVSEILATWHPEQAQESVQDGGWIAGWLGRVWIEPAQVDEETSA